MKPVLDWLTKNHASLVRDLADLVAVPSISTDGEHQKEIEETASLTCEQMRRAGLQNVEVLRSGDSNPYAYGEWLGAPGKPTVFLYAHHDVQPINFAEQWQSEPWTLTARAGRQSNGTLISLFTPPRSCPACGALKLNCAPRRPASRL